MTMRITKDQLKFVFMCRILYQQASCYDYRLTGGTQLDIKCVKTSDTTPKVASGISQCRSLHKLLTCSFARETPRIGNVTEITTAAEIEISTNRQYRLLSR